MAICEVCGLDQFPADTVQWWDEDGRRHFFCSQRHQKEWRPAPREEQPDSAAERTAETASEAGAVLQAEETPPLPAKEAGRTLANAPRKRRTRKGQ